MLSTKKKAILGVTILLLVLFTCVGYAQLSDTLTITGGANAPTQKNVFIVTAEAQDTRYTVNSFYATALNSRVVLDRSTSSKSTVTIKVYNNSNYPYTYNGEKYVNGTGYDNTNIKYTVNNLKKGDEIGPHEYLTFSVTFSFASGGSVNNNILNSLINYEFVPASEFVPEIAVNNALDKFREILNTPDDYATLIGQMDKHTGNRNDSSYIGNVVGSSSADSTTLNTLFTEDGVNYLVLDIGGELTNVTCIIKRDDIYDNPGTPNDEEMTIYLTAEDLNGGGWFDTTADQVFVGVFTRDSLTSEWYQIGELYEGNASKNNYEGGWGRNSFNTDTWKSTKTYHGLTSGKTISQIITAYKSQENN